MLRSFRVANHKSIRDEQELVLLPAYQRDRVALPVAAIYGANAAGKSNVIDALRFMAVAVRESYARWEPGSGVPRTPFRLDPAAIDEPSVYVVDVVLKDVRHVYGMAVDDEQFVEEWLYTYPHGRKRVIFERSHGTIRFGSTLPEYRGRSRLLTELTRTNTSALATAMLANQPEVEATYEWFRSSIAVRRPAKHGLQPRAEAFAPTSPDREMLVELVRAADLGIADVQVIEVPEEPDLASRRLPAIRDLARSASGVTRQRLAAEIAQLERAAAGEPRHRSELVFLHGEGEIPLTAQEQSDGTIAWLNLLTSALNVLRRGMVLCVDELDSSLHPRLTARLIALFQNVESNPCGAQLIFTTHDTSLLGTALGDEVLKRDQIWFVEKAQNGETTLYPLTDFHPRSNENRERRYLGGSYGAVPVTLYEDFQQVLEREAVTDS